MISPHPPFGGGVVPYYAAELRRVLRGPARLFTFAIACAMHAVGHALVALVAGGIAVAMARMWGMRGLRSSPLAGDAPLAEQAFFLSAVGLGVLVVKGAAGIYATYVQGRVAGEVGGRLRLQLLDALLNLHRVRRPRHRDQGGAPLLALARGVSALTERVRDVETGLEQGLLGGLRAGAQLLPLGALLVVLSGRMAIVAAVVLVAFGLLLGRARGGYGRATSREAGQRERLLEAADESVRHADLWVTYGAEAKARERVRALGSALAAGSARLRARAAAMSAANEVLGALALLAAVGASRAGWLGSIADGATLLAFVVAFFLAYRPLRELADARLALARADVAFRELGAVIGSHDGESEPLRSSDLPVSSSPWAPGALELRDLRLAHGVCPPLSLRVEPGTVVAIAGATGIGKTTLLRTLLGLEPAAGGEVIYAGQSLGDAPAGPATRPFAWVPQDAPLLADTLGENVGLGGGCIDARAALDPIGAGHLAGQLEGARLGAGGRAVSGGERQWIALARAIATEQPVLLLDEPTSGLDEQAQRTVLEAIGRLRGKRTVVMVTHRQEPLEVADVVVRLEARAA